MGIIVYLDPEDREKHVRWLLELDGLASVVEDPLAAYCPISLTNTPDDHKPILQGRQDVLMQHILTPAGITAYDPASAPFSPDADLSTQPNVVYAVDSGKIAAARFFAGHNTLPSTGFGIELEKAKNLVRGVVVIMDEGIRVSRMQPHRVIYLQASHLEEQADQFVPVFQMLQEYELGVGKNNGVPCLLGFPINGGAIVDLEQKVYGEFPGLQYHYNGKVPIAQLRVENPEVFYELR